MSRSRLNREADRKIREQDLAITVLRDLLSSERKKSADLERIIRMNQADATAPSAAY